VALRRDDGGGQLERIAGAQRVDTDEPGRRLPYRRDRLDRLPDQGDLMEALHRIDEQARAQRSLSLASGQGRDAPVIGRPPRDDIGIALELAHRGRTRRLRHEQSDRCQPFPLMANSTRG
jgi:hypothetical protein